MIFDLCSETVLELMNAKNKDEEDIILIENYLKLGFVNNSNCFEVYWKNGGNLLSNDEDTKKHLQLCSDNGYGPGHIEISIQLFRGKCPSKQLQKAYDENPQLKTDYKKLKEMAEKLD